jgi:toxin ParE1/3/4
MKKYKIAVTRQANDDIVDTGDYITYTLLEPETAREFVQGLRESISTLIELPYRHPFVDDEVLESQGIRCLPYKNYFIFYQVIENPSTVIVLRVGYSRRNWKKILTSIRIVK